MCVYTGSIPTVDDLPPAIDDILPPAEPDAGRRWTEKGLSPLVFEEKDTGNDRSET